MRETWYKLEDGRTADPNDVAPDEDGVLRHADGTAVAMRGGVPWSIGVDDAEALRAAGAIAVEKAKAAAAEKAKAKK
ncbi:hypothetical protein ACFQ1E_17375 [Sphingomonas canadensis]|uniref:Uncharacterized protein n=1 Tax=Sphingomonas canadensis TaxID=1219257 RepID=A0ABW3H9J0_9SPHN|nr:hypothetical protein [Sphingomonas canadensis]MCW3837819.1 hypothetical protein [Sphingomonas canadensis]